jgi:ribonuclease-3
MPHDPRWYRQALRHRSTLQEGESTTASNERLEFLGDAILSLVVAEHLFARYPDADEGFLTKLRARLVNGKILAACARSIRLGDHLQLSENMERADGRTNRSILSDAYEAVIGAIYLDRGLEAAREFVVRTLLEHADVEDLAQTRDNYKSLLLEMSQAQSWPQPIYETVAEKGPDHDKQFTMKVCIGERELGTGTASSKKSAEQKAARMALERLKRELSAD